MRDIVQGLFITRSINLQPDIKIISIRNGYKMDSFCPNPTGDRTFLENMLNRFRPAFTKRAHSIDIDTSRNKDINTWDGIMHNLPSEKTCFDMAVTFPNPIKTVRTKMQNRVTPINSNLICRI